MSEAGDDSAAISAIASRFNPACRLSDRLIDNPPESIEAGAVVRVAGSDAKRPTVAAAAMNRPSHLRRQAVARRFHRSTVPHSLRPQHVAHRVHRADFRRKRNARGRSRRQQQGRSKARAIGPRSRQSRREIQSGLSLTDRLIDNPPESIEAGAVVRIAGSDAKRPTVAAAESAARRFRDDSRPAIAGLAALARLPRVASDELGRDSFQFVAGQRHHRHRDDAVDDSVRRR